MNHPSIFHRTLQATAIGLLLVTSLHAQVNSRLSTAFLARGEQALLEVSIPNGEPDEVPEISSIPDVTILPTGGLPRPQMMRGRRMEIVFEYIVSSYKVGKHSIPPIEVTVGGETNLTEPIDFEVFDPEILNWVEFESSGKSLLYASSFHTLNHQPYENETTTAEIKLYMPEDVLVDDWGIPDFARDGLTAWRFQPSPLRSRIMLLGKPYIAVAYPSTITPSRTGKVAIGPAKVRLITREAIMNPLYTQTNVELYVNAPKLEIESRKLPANAPAGFDNAVGNFRIEASTSQLEVQEGDPISVDLVVTGSGNLDTLSAPKLANSDGWKVYATTSQERGDERRNLSGSVVFQQSIRPLEMKPEIPSFRLVYFDPKTESYKTAMTEPIALDMRPSTTPNSAATTIVQTLPIPLERMTDILAVISPAQLTVPATPGFPQWIGHAIGGFFALLLIGKAVWMRFVPRLKMDPAQHARLQGIREIEKTKSASDTAFLRAAGNFIETTLGSNPSPALQQILSERDAACFLSEKPKVVLTAKRRDEILKLLRKAIVATLLLLTLNFTPTARAADTASQAQSAYDSAKYDEAIKLWLGAGKYEELSADTLYNIGNACYRSGSPGQASLYYRRALVRDSGHQEARQNLRFLERKYGAITVNRPNYHYALTRISLSTWRSICWTGVWLCALALLVFPATRSGARIRLAAVVALIFGPLIASAGALGWRYFPDDAEFAPIASQAVIVAEKTALHTDAARTAPEVIDAPPGSLCRVIRESGRWAYVAFATKTRGWVPVESIEKVLPEKAPEPPKFRKPKADGKTA